MDKHLNLRCPVCKAICANEADLEDHIDEVHRPEDDPMNGNEGPVEDEEELEEESDAGEEEEEEQLEIEVDVAEDQEEEENEQLPLALVQVQHSGSEDDEELHYFDSTWKNATPFNQGRSKSSGDHSTDESSPSSKKGKRAYRTMGSGRKMSVLEPGPPFLQELNATYLGDDVAEPYQCSICKLTATSKCLLFMHLDRKHGGSDYYEVTKAGVACKQCQDIFPNRRDAVKHHRSKHRDIPPPPIYKCPFCPIRGKRGFIYEHIDEHGQEDVFLYAYTEGNLSMTLYRSNLKFSCNDCRRNFSCRTHKALNHYLTEHLNDGDRFIEPEECSQCGYELYWSQQASRHEMAHSVLEEEQRKKSRKRARFGIVDIEKDRANIKDKGKVHTIKPSTCKLCQMVFPLHEELKSHLRSGQCSGMALLNVSVFKSQVNAAPSSDNDQDPDTETVKEKDVEDIPGPVIKLEISDDFDLYKTKTDGDIAISESEITEKADETLEDAEVAKAQVKSAHKSNMSSPSAKEHLSPRSKNSRRNGNENNSQPLLDKAQGRHCEEKVTDSVKNDLNSAQGSLFKSAEERSETPPTPELQISNGESSVEKADTPYLPEMMKVLPPSILNTETLCHSEEELPAMDSVATGSANWHTPEMSVNTDELSSRVEDEGKNRRASPSPDDLEPLPKKRKCPEDIPEDVYCHVLPSGICRCKVCKKEYASKERLLKHYVLAHKNLGDSRASSRECRSVFNRKKKVDCSFCPKRDMTYLELSDHMERHKESQIVLFMWTEGALQTRLDSKRSSSKRAALLCEYCGTDLSQRLNLALTHYRRCFLMNGGDKTVNSPSNKTFSRPKSCPYCPYKLTSSLHQVRHQRAHEYLKDTTYNIPARENKFPCFICLASFTNKLDLDRHEETKMCYPQSRKQIHLFNDHTLVFQPHEETNQRFVCIASGCTYSKVMKTLQCAIDHHKAAHQTLMCPMCLKVFPRYHEFIDHFRSVHGEIKYRSYLYNEVHLRYNIDRTRFLCTVCPFSQPVHKNGMYLAFTHYTMTHEANLNFKCDAPCTASFLFECTLQLHKKQHNDPDWQKRQADARTAQNQILINKNRMA